MRITAPLFRPRPGTPPEQVDIVQIQPDSFAHSGIFTEVAETLLHGFRNLGYDARIQRNSFQVAVPVIVLAAHLLLPEQALCLPVGAIIYNLEQVRPRTRGADPAFLRLLARHTVWDFDPDNVQAIRQATGHRDVHHVTIGYVPQMTRIPPVPAQDIDVLFYGALTPRREAVIQALQAAGLAVHAAFGVYGSERDALIARSKVVLNLHAYNNWGFELVRVAYLLANRKAVVCEADQPAEIDADLRHAVLAVPYARLVDACAALVRDDAGRGRLEQSGWAAFAARDEAEILRRALTAPPPPPSPLLPVTPRSTVTLREHYLDLLANSLAHGTGGEPPSGIEPSQPAGADPLAAATGGVESGHLPEDGTEAPGLDGSGLRLANIRQLFAAIVESGVPGDLIETGVWDGATCVFMRGLLLAHGIVDRRVLVANGFSRLPPANEGGAPDGGAAGDAAAALDASLEAVREQFRRFDLLDAQVVFLPAWTADAGPGPSPAAQIGGLALLRLDGAVYASAIDALVALYDKVCPGGFVVVEDYGAAQACRAAVGDFRTARGIMTPLQEIDGVGVWWQVPPQQPEPKG